MTKTVPLTEKLSEIIFELHYAYSGESRICMET